jgi:hypothetical protein
MADNTTGSGSTTFLAFLVGGLLIAVAAGGFFLFGGGHLLHTGNQSALPSHVAISVAPSPSH